ncbi:hypothetical protein L1887_57775 [Cichorium endivia]|nr:hypothetical protein L1887_57775 [Cichorium endivia]
MDGWPNSAYAANRKTVHLKVRLHPDTDVIEISDQDEDAQPVGTPLDAAQRLSHEVLRGLVHVRIAAEIEKQQALGVPRCTAAAARPRAQTLQSRRAARQSQCDAGIERHRSTRIGWLHDAL